MIGSIYSGAHAIGVAADATVVGACPLSGPVQRRNAPGLVKGTGGISLGTAAKQLAGTTRATRCNGKN
jgi:hypothetical protein